MKALELVIYPPLERPRLGYAIPAYQEKFRREKVLIESKRLTDAELAAEYWAAHGEANALMTGNRRLLFSRRAALKRFATLPHYDEPTP